MKRRRPKRPPERCPYCAKAIQPFGYAQAALRDPPDEEEAGVLTGQESTPPKTPECDQDPIRSQHLEQIIKRHTGDLPFQEGEFMAFGLSVFAETAARYPEFYKVVVGDSKFPVPTAFIKGAAAAALALRSSGSREGKN